MKRLRRKETVMLVIAAALVLIGLGLYLWRGRPMIFGFLVCLGGAAWLAIWAVSNSRAVHGVLLGLVLAAVAGAAVLEGIVLVNAPSDLEEEPDAMVILGAAVWSNGPSPMMQYRLNTALEYLEEHPGLTVVVSGGQGPEEHMTEAQAMYDYLVARGIDGEQIILEERSENTLQNLSYSRDALEERGLPAEHLLVVSNGYHMARVKLLAGRLGMEVSTLSAPCLNVQSRIYFYARETMGLVKSFLLDHP